jgi:hypothetical protein
MMKRFATACVVRGNEMSNEHTIIVVTLLVGLFTSGTARAIEKSEIKLGDLDCRALLKMNGEDEQSTVLFLHGYASGKAGATAISIPSLTEATDKIREHCIDNPADKLLDVFSKIK